MPAFFIFRMEEKELIEKIKEVIELPLLRKNIEIVDLEWRRERRGWTLRIFIDKPTGISVEDCAKVSSLVGKLLDEHDFIHHSYTLEVSSPGIERPLTKREHFERFAGEKVRITLKNPVEGRKNFTGILLGVEEKNLVIIEVEGKVWRFGLEEIKKARLQPEIKF